MSSNLDSAGGSPMGDEVRNRVKEYRLQHELTQGQLAAAVGVSRQSINSIERGVYVPSLPLALRLAWAFECTVHDLFELEG